jgi:hypothetical protein
LVGIHQFNDPDNDCEYPEKPADGRDDNSHDDIKYPADQEGARGDMQGLCPSLDEILVRGGGRDGRWKGWNANRFFILMAIVAVIIPYVEFIVTGRTSFCEPPTTVTTYRSLGWIIKPTIRANAVVPLK